MPGRTSCRDATKPEACRGRGLVLRRGDAARLPGLDACPGGWTRPGPTVPGRARSRKAPCRPGGPCDDADGARRSGRPTLQGGAPPGRRRGPGRRSGAGRRGEGAMAERGSRMRLVGGGLPFLLAGSLVVLGIVLDPGARDRPPLRPRARVHLVPRPVRRVAREAGGRRVLPGRPVDPPGGRAAPRGHGALPARGRCAGHARGAGRHRRAGDAGRGGLDLRARRHRRHPRRLAQDEDRRPDARGGVPRRGRDPAGGARDPRARRRSTRGRSGSRSS